MVKNNKKQNPSPKKSNNTANENFPLVGIGASAGGLESLKKMFSGDLDNLGMAYIVKVHMMAKQPSLLPEILQKIVTIPAREAQDGETIGVDHIYIVPSDKDVQIIDGCISLKNLPEKKTYNQIDAFFKTLALDQKENAVGVILSGTGSDGSAGIKSIKKNDGLVIVESEESAKYDGMPKSAVSTGASDMILPADQIIPRLVQYYFLNGSGLSINEDNLDPDDHSIWLSKIFSILKVKFGHNFAYYKTNTILRRISRRMGLNQVDNIKKYVTLLKKTPDEVESLFSELLIGVTSFFRDPESFKVLEEKALSTLFKQMSNEETFRIWVPGCSTGEEVYSLAILFKESLDKTEKRINLQIFGTDIDRHAINKAREGIYPDTITSEVSPERMKRYFEKEGNCYKVRKEIRDCAVFSIQDVIKDPPFSKLHLVCCRNLLIYLNSEAQKKILPLFHYTLNPEGIMMLGSSETIGSFSKLFTTVDNKWKIFKRREIPKSLIHQIDFPSGHTSQQQQSFKPSLETKEPAVNIARLAQNLILEQYAPTSVLIDRDGTILYVQGRTGKYLETSSGTPSLNILDLAREGLRIELSSALREASASKQMVIRKNIEVKTNGDYQSINLKVNKINIPPELSDRLLVAFEDIAPVGLKDTSKGDSKHLSKAEKTRINDLEKELQNTRESHQVTIEELESSNEELKSTNEELQSSNEELQSTNEELESSKEELQSLNEELQTVNSELQSKVEELSGAHDDMRNLLNSTQIATIFVDMNINVKRFTSESSKIINLIQTDIGRPLKHVVTNLKDEDLIADVQHVLKHLSVVGKDIQTTDEQWYNMQIMPYRTTDNRIDGAVVTFSNITEQKHAVVEMKTAWDLTRNVFDINQNPLVIINNSGRVVIANTAFSSLIKISPESVETENLYKLKTQRINQIELKKILDHTQKSPQTQLFEDINLFNGKKSSIRTQPLKPEQGRSSFILMEVMSM